MATASRYDQPLSSDDLLTAAAIARAALEPVCDRDWDVPAGDLEWNCRRTLEHLIGALTFYAGVLATRATAFPPAMRIATRDRPPCDALAMMNTAAAVLAEVVRAAPPEARGWHWAGMADASGFVAMGCEEILVHSADIAQGLGVVLHPPDDLAARVRSRLFPWAPVDVAPWDALRWAAGRAALPTRPRLGTDWGWHCAPLAGWDGTVAKAKWPTWPVN